MTDDLVVTGDAAQQLSDFVREVGELLAEDADGVDVEADEADELLTLRLIVADTDLDRFLGRNGRTARSLRTIVAAAAGRFDRRATLDIQADE